MAGVSSQYAAKSDAVDGLASLNAKLAADMNDLIRTLTISPVLSDSWVTMAGNVFRLANITDMERTLAPSTGKPTDGTLWDGEEQALRFLLENGKINLCVRLIEEYSLFMREVEGGSRILSTSDRVHCSRFEFGIGVVLANVWMHKEGIQTTELPLVASAIANILQRALTATPVNIFDAAAAAEKLVAAAAAVAAAGTSDPPTPRPTATSGAISPSVLMPRRVLESVCLRFFLALARGATGPWERRIVLELQKAGAFALALQHLAANSARLDAADVAAGAEGLALLVATEDFAASCRARVLATAGAAAAALRPAFLDKLCEADAGARRRLLRPLLDLCTEAQRKAGKK